MSTLTRETVEQWRARMDAKRQQNAYFRELNEAAIQSQKRRPTTIKTKLTKQAKPAVERKCVVCQNVLPADAAGNRKYCSNSCASAYWNARRGDRKQQPTIRQCPGCKRPTRPSVVRQEDAPGTIPRLRNEFCASCVRNGFKARPPRPDIRQADDPRHGTPAGHQAHQRANHPPCEACIEADRRKHAEMRARKRARKRAEKQQAA